MVKFHYSLIDPRFEILNTLLPLASNYLTLFPYSQLVRTPTGFSKRDIVTNMVSTPAILRCPVAVKI